MRLLIDTHILLWLIREPKRISSAAKAALLDDANQVYVSAASAWEIAIKVHAGKLSVDRGLLTDFDATVKAQGMVQLTVTSEHGIKAGLLNSPHKDPFDRMLAGQALLEHLTMVTADRAFTSMGVKIIW
jgi:PIN domain nuclease of toxin-antitoxin system